LAQIEIACSGDIITVSSKSNSCFLADEITVRPATLRIKETILGKNVGHSTGSINVGTNHQFLKRRADGSASICPDHNKLYAKDSKGHGIEPEK
jgi:hypothetical protein